MTGKSNPIHKSMLGKQQGGSVKAIFSNNLLEVAGVVLLKTLLKVAHRKETEREILSYSFKSGVKMQYLTAKAGQI